MHRNYIPNPDLESPHRPKNEERAEMEALLNKFLIDGNTIENVNSNCTDKRKIRVTGKDSNSII